MNYYEGQQQVNNVNYDVIIGWDPALQRFFLVVQKEDYDEGDETEGMVYSNLDDTHLDLNPDDYQKLEYFRKKFEDFGFTLPEEGWKSIQSFQDATK